MNRKKYYLLSDEECSMICGLLKHHEEELQNMKNLLVRLRGLRILSDNETRCYNDATDEIVKTNSIITKLLN